jgi:hypothetical protein
MIGTEKRKGLLDDIETPKYFAPIILAIPLQKKDSDILNINTVVAKGSLSFKTLIVYL